MDPIFERRDINIHNVTVLHDGGVRNPMAHDLIEADATSFGVAAVMQAGRVSIVLNEVIVNDPIQLVRRHSRLNCFPRLL